MNKKNTPENNIDLNKNIGENFNKLTEENLSEFDENLISQIKYSLEKNDLNSEDKIFYSNLLNFNEVGEKIFGENLFEENKNINALNSYSDSVDFKTDFEYFYGESEDLNVYKIASFIFNYKEKNKINSKKELYDEESFENFLEEENFQGDIQNFEMYLEKYLRKNTFIKKFIKNIKGKILDTLEIIK